MSARSQVAMWKVTSFVFFALLVVGCGKKDANPISTAPGANPTPSADPKKDDPSQPQTPVVLTVAQIKEVQKQSKSFSDDKSFLVEKYSGQLVEVTGKIMVILSDEKRHVPRELHLHAGGESWTNNVAFQMGAQEDMSKSKILPGNIVTLTATIPKKGENGLLVWSISKVTKE